MKNKVIEDRKDVYEVIHKCDVCNLAMIDLEGNPYVIPMNFGMENEIVYFHSSKLGKKIDILKNNNRVCLSFSTDHLLRWQSEKVACSYSMKYRSVLISGKVDFIEGYDEKVNALNIIMRNYTEQEFSYNTPAVNDVMVFRVIADKIEGRIYGY